jgi:hypothetical protein
MFERIGAVGCAVCLVIDGFCAALGFAPHGGWVPYTVADGCLAAAGLILAILALGRKQ